MSKIDYPKELVKFRLKHNITYDAKTKKPNKQFHAFFKKTWVKSDKLGGYTKNNEKGYYQGVFTGFQLGHRKYDLCQLCGKDLKELRKDNLKNRFTKFCNSNHKEEYRKRRIEMEKHNALSLMWEHKTDKDISPSRKNTIMYFLDNKKDYEENRLGLESFGIKYAPWNDNMNTNERPLTTKGRTIPKKEKQY